MLQQQHYYSEQIQQYLTTPILSQSATKMFFHMIKILNTVGSKDS